MKKKTKKALETTGKVVGTGVSVIHTILAVVLFLAALVMVSVVVYFAVRLGTAIWNLNWY